MNPSFPTIHGSRCMLKMEYSFSFVEAKTEISEILLWLNNVHNLKLIPFLRCWYSLGSVLQLREVFDVVIQHSHLRDILLHSGLLGLAHRLLNVEQLPFGCVSTEDCDLMQLKTVQEGRPCL